MVTPGAPPATSATRIALRFMYATTLLSVLVIAALGIRRLVLLFCPAFLSPGNLYPGSVTMRVLAIVVNSLIEGLVILVLLGQPLMLYYNYALRKQARKAPGLLVDVGLALLVYCIAFFLVRPPHG